MSRAATVRVPLRWRDLDVLGHMYQGRYHELLDEARAAIFAPVAGRLGFPFVLVRIELDHRREVTRADGALDVRSRVTEIGTSSVTIEHEFALLNGHVVASGRSIMVAWDRDRRGSRPIADDERAFLLSAEVAASGFTASAIERLRAGGVIS